MHRLVEEALGKTALKQLPIQPGDVPATFADVDALQRAAGFAPNMPAAVRRSSPQGSTNQSPCTRCATACRPAH
jgi:hypothetical protein